MACVFTPLSFDVKRTNGSCLVEVAGEVDLATAAELAGLLSEVGGQVTLDLTRVTFMDLSGLAVLARAQRDIAEGGGALHVRGASPTVLKVLEITGLLDVRRVTA